ncbi:MAG: hypothetical protein [Caudoviricetes sp.]|nr:MAG: hypothetical protein [Caudoviricetes sp.]
MADTASLIARVKTEGVDQFNRQLTDLAQNSTRSDSAVKKLTDDLKLQNAQYGKSKEQITLMNAALAGATKAELDLIRALHAESAELKRVEALRNSAASVAGATTGKLGALGAAAGQVGFQVQDMVVQLAGGASAFVAIGQQGSQLASAFGPGGAVLGAVIALAAAAGGVLYKAFGDAAVSAQDLDKSASELAKSFQQSKDGTLEFSDALVALSQSGDLAYDSTVKLLGLQADKQIDDVTKAIKDQGEALLGTAVAGQTNTATLDALIAKNADVAKTLDSVNVVADAGTGIYANLKAAVGDLAAEYGVGTREITDMLVAQRQFNALPSAENAQRYADATSRAAAAAKENKGELLDQAVALQKNANALATAEKQQNLVTTSQQRLGAATNSTTQRINEQNSAIVKNAQIAILSDRDRAKAMAASDKEAFAAREGVTEEQIKAYNAARDEEARQDIARINATEQRKNDVVARQSDNRAAQQTKRAETEAQRQQKQAQDFLATIERQNQDELAAIDAKEKQKLEKLQQFNQQGQIVGKQFEDAKTQIALDADAERNDLLQKQTEERMKKQNSADSYLEQLRAQNEGELAEIDRQNGVKQQKLDDFYNQGLVSESDYQTAKENIAAAFDKERVAKYSSMLGQTTDDLKTALGEGNKAYKAFAIANAIMNTYQGAVAAFQSAAAIPLVGWIAAPVAAAAAVAAGLANVAKIRSAREQGGSLAAGGISMVGERNKAELIMPAGASRVRTMEQVQQMMGGKGANANGTPAVTIVNNTSGRIDSATTEQDDEGRLRVIISETVSRALQDSNSQISKSRRATRGQPGFS